MAGSVDNHGDGALLDSWDVSDLDSTMSRLILSSKRECNNPSPKLSRNSSDFDSVPVRSSSGGVLEDMVNSVDQFLREALQNPRERLSVLRMEQDIIKFIKDPSQQQMEFQQLPTSYLRLAAHRVAQHYSLQSTALLDNNLPECSGSRIIIQKTSESRLPLIRLADIPVKLPTDDFNNSVVKVSIKQRPNNSLQNIGSNSSAAQRSNSLKSVDERKEDYNRARARIFNSSSSLDASNLEEVSSSTVVDMNGTWSRSGGNRVHESIIGPRNNSKVAIFRDHEVERNDPDYDRSYDRYAQRFDPGYGYNGSSYPVQPMYASIFTYNTEFPQLGSVHTHRASSILTEHQPHTLGQPIPGSWVTSSSPAGIGYGPTETMVNPYSLNHAYMQYSSQRSGLTFIHPREQVHQQWTQSQQLQHDSTFGLARPR